MRVAPRLQGRGTEAGCRPKRLLDGESHRACKDQKLPAATSTIRTVKYAHSFLKPAIRMDPGHTFQKASIEGQL